MEHQGRILTSADVEGLRLAEIVYETDVRDTKHSHEEAHFCIALEGECKEFYLNKAFNYRPFTIGFFPPDHSHSLEYPRKGFRWFRMQLDSVWLEKLSRNFSGNLEPVHAHGGPLSELFLRLYKEYRHSGNASDLVIEALALEMLVEISRRKKPKDRNPPLWLLRIRDLVEASFTEELNLLRLADAVDMHPVHVAREFRRHYGCTVGEYVRNKRMDYVCRKLRSSEIPIAEIALTAGFCDQSHLSRTFRRLIGITPAKYRRISRAS